MRIMDIALLKRLEPVASLAPEQLEYILMYSKIEKCAPGTCLFRQGDMGDYFYMLNEGTALVTRVVAGAGESNEGEGESIELTELSAGNGFGEAALLSDKPRNASVSSANNFTPSPARRERGNNVFLK